MFTRLASVIAVGASMVLYASAPAALILHEEFTIFEGEVENFSAGLFRIDNDSDWTRGWRMSLGEGGSNLLLTAVPEPGAWTVLFWALAGGLLVRRRNTKVQW